MNIAFWNINRQPLEKIILELCKNYSIDVLGLAESQNTNDSILIHAGYKKISILGKVAVYIKFSEKLMIHREEHSRYIFTVINTPVEGRVILSFCHLIDRRNNLPQTRAIEIMKYVNDIKTIEKRFDIKRTLVIGDFNINPFDIEMVGAGTFNATLDKTLAKRSKQRKVQSSEYSYFYNPMWKFYNNTERPYGSYYYNANDHESHHWNILDNIIIRPDLIDLFVEDDLRIITKIGNHELVNKKSGLIDKLRYSDHLPIVCKLLL